MPKTKQKQTKTTDKTKTKKALPKSSTKPVVAKGDDGNIQITLTISFAAIDKARLESAADLAKNIEIPGFRKGKAPLEKAIEKIPQETLIETTLGKILPKMFGEVVTEHKLKPAIYPRFELIKATEGEDWQVRAITCEIPEVKIGDYKKLISGEAKAKAIWTPGKGEPKDEKQKELSPQEKEQVVLKALLDNIKFKIPQVLIDNETNSRLSQVLARVEKLGLQLESYLTSVGKTPEQLRKEYEIQSEQALRVDFILAKIAEEEKATIDKTQIDAAIAASQADPETAKKLDTPEQRRVIESILIRRSILNKLVSLIS